MRGQGRDQPVGMVHDDRGAEDRRCGAQATGTEAGPAISAMRWAPGKKGKDRETVEGPLPTPKP